MQKTYLPIIRLSIENLQEPENSFQLDTLHSKFLDSLKVDVISDQQFIELIGNNTFGFLFGEIFDNIEEHSNADNIYIFAQYFLKHNSCEICIVDDGQGLYGSLKNANRGVKDSQDRML